MLNDGDARAVPVALRTVTDAREIGFRIQIKEMYVGITPGVSRQPGGIWRFLQFSLTRIVIAAVAVVAVRLLVEAVARFAGVKAHTSAELLVALLVVAVTLATYDGYVSLIERRSVVELAARRAPSEAAAGLLCGALLFAAVILVLVGAGVVRLSTGEGLAVLPYALAAAAVAAVWEEALLRGVLFRIVEESLGSWIALTFSAAIFGGLHAFNKGATLTSSVAIALEAGVLLGAVYMYTRRLWMPIGLHAGWNFTEGGIFGASVSGGHAEGMLSSRFRVGPDLLTGGQFGPEASVVAVVVCLGVGVVFLVLAIKRQRILPPRWRRACGTEDG
jgi:uncharacterized protein